MDVMVRCTISFKIERKKGKRNAKSQLTKCEWWMGAHAWPCACPRCRELPNKNTPPYVPSEHSEEDDDEHYDEEYEMQDRTPITTLWWPHGRWGLISMRLKCLPIGLQYRVLGILERIVIFSTMKPDFNQFFSLRWVEYYFIYVFILMSPATYM